MKRRLALLTVAILGTVSAFAFGAPKIAHAGSKTLQCNWEYGTPHWFYNETSNLLWVELDDEYCNSNGNEYRYLLTVWSPFPYDWTVRTEQNIDVWRCGAAINSVFHTFSTFNGSQQLESGWYTSYGGCGPEASDGPNGSHINEYETNTYQIYANTPCVVIGAGKCNGF